MSDDDGNSTASSLSVPLHVFISYAHVDEALVHHIREILSRRGIATWFDREDLQPGTPDWEAAIKDAISRSFCVIFLATPAAYASMATREELRLAREAQIDIIPLWANGRKWAHAAPQLVEKTQYIDGRGRRKLKTGLARLADIVTLAVERKAQKHFVLIDRTSLPPGYLLIEIQHGISIAFREASYATLAQLLNDLYAYYLYQIYQPRTYGSQWILASARSLVSDLADVGRQMIVPWEWLTTSTNSTPIEFPAQWDIHPPRHYNMENMTAWRVESFLPEHVEQLFGVVADDDDLIELLRAYPTLPRSRTVGKFLHSMFAFGDWYAAERIQPEHHEFTGVYTYGRPITHGGMAFLARDDPRAYSEAGVLGTSHAQEP